MKKKLLLVISLILAFASVFAVSVFAQGASTCENCDVCNPQTEVDDEMPPMEVRINGEAFLESLGLMGKGMVGIFVVTLVIIGVVAILNWHGKSMDDRKNKRQ